MDTTHYPLDTEFEIKTKVRYVYMYNIHTNKMSEESNDATTKTLYENPIPGYGSIHDALTQASNINPTIQVHDARDYLNKLKHRRTEFHYKTITHSYLLTLCLTSKLA